MNSVGWLLVLVFALCGAGALAGRIVPEQRNPVLLAWTGSLASLVALWAGADVLWSGHGFQGQLWTILPLGTLSVSLDGLSALFLGGLICAMPWTAGGFLVGSLAISALPPFNGFVSEWLTLQTMLRSTELPSTLVKLVFVLCGAGLALTAALAYTATGFSNPVRVVFDALFRPTTVEDTRLSVELHFRTAIRREREEVHVVDRSVIQPAKRAALELARGLAAMHHGRINAYVAYVLLALLVALAMGLLL